MENNCIRCERGMNCKGHFQIIWFIKETEKIPGKIHKEHQFLSFTSTILGEKRKSDSQIQKRFSVDKVILVNHCSCWIGFWYGYEQEIVTSKAWIMKENPQILSISANLYAIHYFYKENWVPHFFTQGSFQFKPRLQYFSCISIYTAYFILERFKQGLFAFYTW